MPCPILPHDPLVFTEDQKAPLGQEYEMGDGRKYVYVQFGGAVTYVSGHTLTWESRVGSIATNDESGGNDFPAGVLPASKRLGTASVPTEDQYGLIQTKGYHPAVFKVAATDSFAIGLGAIIHATTDGAAGKASASPPAVADLKRWLGVIAAASEDTATGTWNEDTVPIDLDVGSGGFGNTTTLDS